MNLDNECLNKIEWIHLWIYLWITKYEEKLIKINFKDVVASWLNLLF